MASIDVVIPVLNEEQALPGCIDTLREFLAAELGQHQWRVVIADNGSEDGTLGVAKHYAQQYPANLGYIHLDARGRGRALRRAWLDSEADMVSYMDVDLSTGLEAFPAMARAIIEEGYDVAYGSRLAKAAEIERSFKRDMISRTYNAVIKLSMRTGFSDAQCGFKALSREAARTLVPAVVNNHWFFDTELLIIAEKRGFRLKEVPVKWEEDPDTRVKIAQTVMEDLKGLARLRFGGIPKIERPGNGPQ
jgi:glycosyltransferase involved in cell wall biosynthesis